jgi:transcriptional regulator GlxA family with amidase domain
MKQISILVPKGAASVSCIEGSFKAFTTANEFLIARNKKPLFKINFVGLDLNEQVYDGVFKITPDSTVSDIKRTDLIIIPAVNGDWRAVIEMNSGFRNWIINMHKCGSEVASLCVGAFLLASTGLLKGKKCSTHWFAQNEFRKLFPDVSLVPDVVITDDNGVYSSGGANSFWNLLIYILEKYTDRELAVLTSKYYEIEIDRFTQSAFSMFNGQKKHDDMPVKRAQEFIEKNFQEKLSVDQLADMFSLGRRSLERRFKKATHNTVVEYIQRVKIEAAKKSLETSSKNINEVMFDVGYSDTKAFRYTFKKFSGLTPADYRNKYNKALITV